MAFEFALNSLEDWSLGLSQCQGADEGGEFNMFTIGLLFCSLHVISYQGDQA